MVGTASFKAPSFQLPIGKELAVDAAGNLYIADTLNHRVRVVWK